MSDVWAALALEHAIEPVTAPEPGTDIALAGPGLPVTGYDVRTTPVLHPSRVARFVSPPRRRLLVTGRATAAAVQAAQQAGLSVLVAPDGGPVTGVLVDVAGRPHVVEPVPSPSVSPPPRRPGRTPWGTIALLLALLDDPTPRTQDQLAERAGLTQARVSQAFADLTGLVTREGRGWTLPDAAAAAAWVVARYPPPVKAATWLSLDEPVPTARRVAAVLADAGVDHAVTGQVAADVYAPWARPDRATIWTTRMIDLTAAGCTPVAAAEANIALVVPDDPYALTAARERDGLRLADAWRTWVTLAHDGDDAAAGRLRRRLLDRRPGSA